MNQHDLYECACRFRKAIVAAKEDRRFNKDFRMRDFPNGCCDDASDLFAHYLFHEKDIESKYIRGAFYNGDPEYNCSHVWLEVAGYIVDLTGSQSQFRNDPVFLKYCRDTYVGVMDSFHELFEIDRVECRRGIENLGVDSWNRMYNLYDTIMEYM